VKSVRNGILHIIVLNKKTFFSETHIDSTDVSISSLFPAAVASDKKE
jgi:hypothetical protein